MPLEKFPVVTQQDVHSAQREQIVATLKAATTTLGLTAFNYRFNAPGGPVIQKPVQAIFTGVEAKPTPTGRAAVRFPLLSLPAAFLPAPVGYVPPEFYGLHPDVVFHTAGLHLGRKPIDFTASDTRVRVFEARRIGNEIEKRLLTSGLVTLHRVSSLHGATINPGRVPITPEEFAFLKSLPPGVAEVQTLIPALEARQGDFLPPPRLLTAADLGAPVPTTGSVFGTRFPVLIDSSRALLTGSVQPERHRSTNWKEIANDGARSGVEKLVANHGQDP